MPKIVQYVLPAGGTVVDVAANNATALDIEQAGADYITVDTTGSGSVIIGKALTLEAGFATSGNIEIENTSPTLTFDNSTAEDTDGGRESQIDFTGLQSGSEAHTLGRIQVSHDGSADDQKGKLVLSVNDGSDGATPTAALSIASTGNVSIGTVSTSRTLTVGGEFRVEAEGINDLFQIVNAAGASTDGILGITQGDINFTLKSGSSNFSVKDSSGALFTVFEDGKITSGGETSPLCVAGGIHIVGPGGTTSRTSIAAGASQLVVEDNGSDGAGITIIADDSKVCSIDFYTDTQANGSIRWQQSMDAFRFYTNNKEPLRLYDTKVTSFVGYQYHAGTGDDDAATQPLYLADSGATLVVDTRFGNFGDVTLTANITAVKFFYRPDDGFVYTMTAKIKQHASSEKTIDYADSAVTVYSDGGSTEVTGEMKWAGGVHHTMSTGYDDVDIVQFTIFPNGSTFNVYAAVIGQDFS